MTASPPFASPTAANVVTLLTYNTVTVAPGATLQLVTSTAPGAGPTYYNILNLGGGAVYLSDSETPSAGAPNVLTLPANWAHNGTFMGEGTRGVYVLGDVSGCTLSVYVAPSIGVW